MQILLHLAILLLTGWLVGRIGKLCHLPNVSGYLIAGLLLGPSFFHLLTKDNLNSMLVISEVALSIVAFTITSEFTIRELKKIGKSIFIITLAEVAGAVLLVFVLMYFVCNQDFNFSIIIAAMSASTAPAATLLVMRQYRSDGPLTRTILPVVALDDVFGIIAFGIAVSIARVNIGTQDLTFWQMAAEPFREIFLSFLVGAILGLFMVPVVKKANDTDELLIVTLGMILLCTGLSNIWSLSPLLSNIMMGTVMVNIMHNSNKVYFSLNHFTPPLFLLFFALAGASLDVSVLFKVSTVGFVYIAARAIGKVGGAWASAKATNSPAVVQKYLGLALLPQGGVAIGLSILVRRYLPDHSDEIVTIIMFGILVYEVLGPFFAKVAIEKAGEVGGLDRIANNRE